jgi:cell division transport system permease protein
MAILLGIEFYMVFDRTTDNYEERLKEGYAMLVVANKPISPEAFKKLNEQIAQSELIKRDTIVKEIADGVNKANRDKILKSLPYFYNLHLDEYIHTSGLEKIKRDLEASKDIKRVETFGSSYSSNYRLFSFIKFTLKVFIAFMAIVSFFLIIKQMEIWKYEHQERMQIMEVFGAPLMLRSGVLFKVAIIDAFFATFLVSGLFLYVKFQWAMQSGIDIMIQHKDALFMMSDLGVLLATALAIVIVAVYSVVYASKGVQE